MGAVFDPPVLQLDALVDGWLRFLEERPGRPLSTTRRAQVSRHLGVLHRVAATRAGGLDPDAAVLLVDTGSGLLAVSEGSMDWLGARLAVAGFPATSRQRIVGTWREFERWLLVEFPGPVRVASPRLVSFVQDDIVGLVEAAGSPSPHDGIAWPTRDRALLAVLLGVGLRSIEVLSLVRNDVSLEPPSLTVGTARSRSRRVPLRASVVAELVSYLAERAMDTGEDALFVRRDGRAFLSGALHEIVKRLVLRVRPDVEGSQRLRVFRTTYVYGELGRGVVPSVIAWRLGLRAPQLGPCVDSYHPGLGVDLDAALTAAST